MAQRKRPVKKATRKQTLQEKRETSVVKDTTCIFCKEGNYLSYKEKDILVNFLSDRGKIVARTRTGLCSKHQRKLALEIKKARYLALLPFKLRPE